MSAFGFGFGHGLGGRDWGAGGSPGEAPFITFSRVSTSAMVTGPEAWADAGQKHWYIPTIVDVRDHALHGPEGLTAFLYYSTDHASDDGGVGMWVCMGDPRVYANWKSYEAAVTAGWLAHVTSKPAGNPVLVHATGSSQTESPWVQLMPGGNFVMTYSVWFGVDGISYQSTRRSVSADGVNWTPSPTSLLITPTDQLGGLASGTDKNTGYMQWGRNYAADFPYDWIGRSLIWGGASGGASAWWGTDDPEAGSWTWVAPAVQWAGPASDAIPPGVSRPKLLQLGPWQRQTPAGVLCAFPIAERGGGSVSGASTAGEVLLNATGLRPAAQARQTMEAGGLGAFDELTSGINNWMEYDGQYVAVYGGVNAAGTVRGLGIAVADIDPGVSYAPAALSATVPSGLATEQIDFKLISAIPAGWTEYKVGTVTPSTSFGASGMSVTVDGSQAIKGEYYLYGPDFVPDDVEFIDIWIDDIITTSTNAYRRIGLGFTRAASSGAIGTSESILIDGTAADNWWRKVFNYAATRNSVAMNAVGPGHGTGTTPYAKHNKSIGLRWYVNKGRILFLSEGEVEYQDFQIPPLTLADTAATWRPVFYLLGTSTEATTERIAGLRVRQKAGDGTAATRRVAEGLSAIVDLDYERDIYCIGEDVFTSLAAFEADGRVTTLGTRRHRVNHGTALSEAAIQVLTTVQLPASSVHWIACCDDGAPSNPQDNAFELRISSTGRCYPHIVIGGVAGMTFSATPYSNNMATRANGNLINVVTSGAANHLTTSEKTVTADSEVTSGSWPAGLSQFIVGGKDDTGVYTGTIHRAILYGQKLRYEAAASYAGMA